MKLAMAALPSLLICILLKKTYISAFFEPVALGIVVMWLALKAKPLFIFLDFMTFRIDCI